MSNHQATDARSILTEDIGSLAKTLSRDLLPVSASQRSQLLSMLANEQLSLAEFSARLHESPAAALQLCRAAGDIARKRDIDVLTLEQACNLLGTQRIRQAIEALPLTEDAQLPAACRQMLLISQHALFQSQGLFAQRMARVWPELALASLLFLAPCWLLARRHPAIFDHWDSHNLLPRIDDGSGPGHDGQWLLQLSRQLAEEWWLSPWITRGLKTLAEHRRQMVRALRIAHDSAHPRQQQLALDNDRQLYRWLVQPANAPLIANGIALGALHTWQGHQTLRWQQLAALYLGSALEDICSLNHQQAVSLCQRRYPEGSSDLWLPAAALPWPDGGRLPQQQPQATRSPDTPAPGKTGKPATPAADLDVQCWRNACQQLLNSPQGFHNLQALLGCATEALQQGLGLPAHWIALYNAGKEQLLVVAAHGQPAASRVIGQSFACSRNTQWYRWLSENPVALIESASRPELGALLPGPLKLLLGEHRHCLLPLWKDQQLIGMIACDLQSLDPRQRQQRLTPLRKTAECLQKALIAFRR